jgi:hypothetical protein
MELVGRTVRAFLHALALPTVLVLLVNRNVRQPPCHSGKVFSRVAAIGSRLKETCRIDSAIHPRP